MLVDSISTVATYIKIHKNFNIAVLNPSLALAEQQTARLLGEPLYQTLTGAKADNSILLIEKAVLLQLLCACQRHIVLYAMNEAFNELRSQVSEMGVQQTYTDSAGVSRPAPVADAKALRDDYARRAYIAADDLLVFLEKHQNNPHIVVWKDSDTYTENFALFIRNAVQFAQRVPTVRSRQAYLALRPGLINAENLTLKAILCRPLFDDLKKYVKFYVAGESLAEFPVEYRELLEHVQNCCAYDALQRSLAYIDVVLDHGQLFLSEYASADARRTPTTERAIEQLRAQARKDADAYADHLKFFLEANIDNLPHYRDSPCGQRIVAARNKGGICTRDQSNATSVAISRRRNR